MILAATRVAADLLQSLTSTGNYVDRLDGWGNLI
jgi:hypothetical protein